MGYTKLDHLCKDEKNNKTAICFMFLAVIFYSLIPVFIHAGDAKQDPFIFNAIRLMFLCIGIMIFLILFYWKELINYEIWKIISKNALKLSMIGSILGSFNYAIFAFSLKYIDVALATVIYDTWPIWMILLTGKMFQKEKHYQKTHIMEWGCIIIAFLGLCLVVSSESGMLFLYHNNMESLYSLSMGVVLALAAAIIGALSSGCTIKWGRDIINKNLEVKPKETGNMTVFFVLFATFAASVINFITIILFNNFTANSNEFIYTENVIIAAILGLFISTPATLFFRTANVITTKLEINVMGYLTPIFTLACLIVMGYADVVRMDWLIIGALLIVTTNILLYLNSLRDTGKSKFIFSIQYILCYFKK